MQLQVNPQILSVAGHSGTVDVLLFTQFVVHWEFRCIRVLNSALVDWARCTLGFRFPKKYAQQNEPLNQGNLHELKLRLKIVRYPGIEVGEVLAIFIYGGVPMKGQIQTPKYGFTVKFAPKTIVILHICYPKYG